MTPSIGNQHIADMEYAMTLLQQDLQNSYEAYKTCVTDKDTYLEQKKMYEQMMKENIEKQQVAVIQISDMNIPETVGLEMLDGRIQLMKLAKEIVDRDYCDCRFKNRYQKENLLNAITYINCMITRIIYLITIILILLMLCDIFYM